MRNSSQHPFNTSQPKFSSPNPHFTSKPPPFTDITKSNTLTPPQHKSSNSHVRTSSFSISIQPVSQSPFSNNSLALEPSHKPLGHRRNNSLSHSENASTFITRFPTSFQDDSCNIPSTLRNNQGKENRPSGLYAPSLTSSLLLNESSLKNHPTNSPFRHQREPSTQSPYRTDTSNNFVSNPFSKQQQQQPFEMTFTPASAFNNHLNYNKPSSKPINHDEFREVNETLHSFPHAGFFEITPKQLDTEERLPTELGLDSIYHSPPKIYQQQYIGSPELLRRQNQEYLSRPSNANIRDTAAERFSFEGKGHQGDSSVVYFCSKGTLNETSFRDPLTATKELLIPQQPTPKDPESPEDSRSPSPEDKQQALESPNPSDYILSLASNRDARSARSHQVKSVCSQQLSSKRDNMPMQMPEVKFFKDRFPVISHSNLPLPSQEESNPQQEASIHHHQEEEIMIECKKFSITEIMEEVKKIEKTCENKPNTQVLDFPESARQLLPSTLQVIPEDPQQEPETTPFIRKQGPEPLFCDESTILYNSQSATLVTSPNKLDRKIDKLALGGQVDDSGSITDFTLKTEPKLSERSQRDNPINAPVSLSERVNLVLKKLGEKLKTAEEIHQRSPLLSFQKDTKIDSVFKALPHEQEFHTFEFKKNNDFKGVPHNEIEVYSFGAKEVTPSSIKDSEGFPSNSEKSHDKERVQDFVRNEMAKVKENLMKYKAVIEPQNGSSFRKMDTMSLEDTLRGTGGVECYEEAESQQRSFKPPSYNFERFNPQNSNKSKPLHQTRIIPNDNPDLIAHIEYNYQPLNPIIYEESQEKTDLNTPDGTPCKKDNNLVDLYGTAQETAFALPNYETAKEVDFHTLEREIVNKMGEYQQEITQKISDISLKMDKHFASPSPITSKPRDLPRPASDSHHKSRVNSSARPPLYSQSNNKNNSSVEIIDLPRQIVTPSPSVSHWEEPSKQQPQSIAPSTGSHTRRSSTPILDSYSRRSSMVSLDDPQPFSMISIQPNHPQRQADPEPTQNYRNYNQMQAELMLQHQQQLQDLKQATSRQSSARVSQRSVGKSIRCSPRMDAVLQNNNDRSLKYSEESVSFTVDYNSKSREETRESQGKGNKSMSREIKGGHSRSRSSFTGDLSGLMNNPRGGDIYQAYKNFSNLQKQEKKVAKQRSENKTRGTDQSLSMSNLDQNEVSPFDITQDYVENNASNIIRNYARSLMSGYPKSPLRENERGGDLQQGGNGTRGCEVRLGVRRCSYN